VGCTRETGKQWLWGPVERLVRPSRWGMALRRLAGFGDGLRTMRIPESRNGAGMGEAGAMRWIERRAWSVESMN